MYPLRVRASWPVVTSHTFKDRVRSHDPEARRRPSGLKQTLVSMLVCRLFSSVVAPERVAKNG
jgi:hypothetical protein